MRIFTLTLIVLMIAGSAVAKVGAGILQLQGAGGTYTATLDPQGNATIPNVKPGNYQMTLLVPAVQKAPSRLTGQGTPTADKHHSGEIHIESFSWGASSVGSANGGVWKTSNGAQPSGREASVPSVSEIVVTKDQDAASANGWYRTVPRVVLRLEEKTKHSGQDYYKIKLTDILVSGVQSSGGSSSGGDRPTESLSLNFTKITYSVK